VDSAKRNGRTNSQEIAIRLQRSINHDDIADKILERPPSFYTELPPGVWELLRALRTPKQEDETP
jgi:hypothetical protein